MIQNSKAQRKYLPTNDVIFKCLFGNAGNERITKKFLEYVTGEKIEEVSTDFKLELLKEKPEDKQMISDLIAKDNKLQKYIIEMQKRAYDYLPNRFIGYMSKTYVAYIKVKEEYNTLKRTVLVVLMEEGFPNLEDIEEYHTVWHYREQKYREKVLTKCTEIHILELNKYKKQKKIKGKLDPWLEFFINPYGKEVADMARTRAELEEAVRQLRLLSADEEVQQLADAEDWARYDYNSMLFEEKEKARAAGLEEGREEGREEGLEKGLEEGREKGREEGRAEGRAEGRKEGHTEGIVENKIETAKRMKNLGIEIDIIKKITDLTIEEIERL